MSSSRSAARTYNQEHIPRQYTSGKRRLSIYWTWSYAWESQRDPAEMTNRFSTMTEVRNVLWPGYETPEWSSNFSIEQVLCCSRNEKTSEAVTVTLASASTLKQ